MKEMAVGYLKTHFSEIISEVRDGGTVGILYGRAKEPVAMLVPYNYGNKAPRKIGILDGQTTISFRSDFAMTAEELCSL